MDWGERLQSGDWVIVEDNVGRGTLTQIVACSGISVTLEDGRRFSRVTGKKMGHLEGDYEYRLVDATRTRMAEMQRFQLANRLASIRWAFMPLDMLIMVANALDDPHNDPPFGIGNNGEPA